MTYTPDMNDGKHVFVFGSNLAGIHGAGAAKEAREHWGAQANFGVGRTGNAYAIPTKGFNIQTRPLSRIAPSVEAFLSYAEKHPNLTFLVTRIGCGLAGYKDSDIAPMFKGVPSNCVMPEEWKEFLQ